MGDAVAISSTTPGGRPRQAKTRRRAVGTRDRITGYLALIGEITDPAGMASARLATAVAYPGSSVAFAQLLSGMERDGLISREVRGKRTYRITLTTPVPVRTAREPASGTPAPPEAPPVPFPATIDYDALARRVLVHLVRCLSELNAAEVMALERLLTSKGDTSSSATA